MFNIKYLGLISRTLGPQKDFKDYFWRTQFFVNSFFYSIKILNTNLCIFGLLASMHQLYLVKPSLAALQLELGNPKDYEKDPNIPS